jgi:hypothetical protein
MHHSPSNLLLDEAKAFVADKLPGTPEWALFPRWTTDGKTMWIQSSSGGALATIHFHSGEIRMSSRLGEKQHGGEVFKIPAHWLGEFHAYA